MKINRFLKAKIGKYPTASFFLITFAISWGVWIPLAVAGIGTEWYKLGTFGPLVAALILFGIVEGPSGYKRVLHSLLRWRERPFWYMFALFATPGTALLAVYSYKLAGGRGLVFNDIATLYLVIPVFLYVLFFSVLGEEIGWRGYALPRLQSKYSALQASLILGVIWGCWHLPLFYLPGDFHQDLPFSLFVLQTCGFSLLYTWMYNSTGGNLLLIHLLHASANTAVGVLPVLPASAGGSLVPLYLLIGMLIIWALLLTLVKGSKTLSSMSKFTV